MLKMTIDNEEVLSNNDISIKEEILSPSSTILNNVYPKSWELDKDYTSRFYYPKDYSKLNIQNFSIEPEEVGKTIQVNGSATLTDVDTSKESRVLRLLGQTSQTGTPTPSSPIPINVVSGDNYIDICGKNLLVPDTTTTRTSNGITSVINEDGSLTLTGTATANAYLKFTSDMTLESNTTYTTLNQNSILPNNVTMYYNSVGNIGSTYADTVISPGGRLKTYTTGEVNGTISIAILVQTGVTINTTLYPMLLKGTYTTSNIPTYEPYIGNTYPIYLGVENLAQITATGSYNCTLSDGVFTSISYSGYGNIRPAITQITLPANKTIYYSADIRLKSGTSSGALNNMAIFGTTNTYTTNKLVNPTISSEFQRYIFSITPTIDEPAKGLLIQTNSGSSNAVIEIKNIMISYSYSHDFYEYGTTPIELCKIPNTTYQDYIYKDNGSWYLHKEIGKVVLDGSETGWSKSSTTNIDRFYIELQKGYLDSYNRLLAYSNYYKYTTNLNVFEVGNMQMGSYQQNTRLFLDYSVYNTTTLEQFKTWLSTHNTIVYYVLTTPTNTEITDTTLLEQLESLSS